MLFSVCFHSERLTFVLYISLEQPEFFRVGVVPWNKNTSIVSHLKHKRKNTHYEFRSPFL